MNTKQPFLQNLQRIDTKTLRKEFCKIDSEFNRHLSELDKYPEVFDNIYKTLEIIQPITGNTLSTLALNFTNVYLLKRTLEKILLERDNMKVLTAENFVTTELGMLQGSDEWIDIFSEKTIPKKIVDELEKIFGHCEGYTLHIYYEGTARVEEAKTNCSIEDSEPRIVEEERSITQITASSIISDSYMDEDRDLPKSIFPIMAEFYDDRIYAEELDYKEENNEIDN